MDPYVREREVVHEPVERDRVIVTEDRPRSGAGGLIGTIVAVALVLLVAWFLLNALGVLGESADEDVNVEVPPVNVETND